MDPVHLFLIICAVLIVLKLLRATAKLMVSAAVITAVVYVLLYVL